VRLGFDSRRGLGIFLFATASRTALGPTQPPIRWVLGILSPGIKRPGREADHLSPTSAEVKNTWSYTSTPQYVFMIWLLVKHRVNFTFIITWISVYADKSSSSISRTTQYITAFVNGVWLPNRLVQVPPPPKVSVLHLILHGGSSACTAVIFSVIHSLYWLFRKKEA
jgi:hypothetical protein